MGNKTEPAITKCKEGENWTRVTFKPDLEKFKMTYLEEDVVALMKKRVLDMAGCLGKTVKVELNGRLIRIKLFKDYADLYLKSAEKSRPVPLPRIHTKVGDRWEICVSLTDGQFQQVSFVNSIATIKGGTHVDYITNQIITFVMNKVNKKKKDANVKAHNVKNHLWVFVNALIDNPAFDSQTKETLTTRQASFGSKCDVPKSMLKDVANSGIVDTLLSWSVFKQSNDLKKTDGTKTQRICGIVKLEDANDAGGRNSEKCTLILTERDSAKALAMDGLSVVGRDHYGAFPSGGKLLNVREASRKQIMDSEAIQNMKKILGLQQNKEYTSVKSLRCGHLMIMADQEQSHDIKSSKVAPEADHFVPLIPAVKTEHGHESLEPFPGSVIVVNTRNQNVDKEMIVCRSSSYRVILALEKEGIQVVERDLNLPVDIILSSAICLAWYDSGNLGKKATPSTEASSSLSLCVENIATDVLAAISLCFRSCFLVFEGEFNFLSAVMESSEGLYAAAGSLGIDLQIFFSYSPDLTNEVRIYCIRSSATLTKGLYPKMPDSVTLAESFLTQFPGVNPLTAHSILSSGIMLNEFLAWSHEQRMRVLARYHVPEESLSLFSVFCRYGEREDSKSIMTDCSSLISSDLHSSSLSKPFDLGMSKDIGRYRDMGKDTLCTSGLFRQKQGNIATRMRNPSNVSPSSRNYKAPKISVLLEQPNSALKIKELAQNEIMDIDLMGKSLNWHKLGNFEKLHMNVRGEVVDLTDNPLLDENFPISDPMFFPNLMTDIEKDQIRKNMEINSSKTWRSMTDTGEVEIYAELNCGKDAFPLDFKYHENIGSIPFQEEMSHLSKAPLLRGQQSVGALKHSPCTAEPKVFKEKKSKRRMVSPTKKGGRNHSLLEYFPLL